ncbi:OadG family protein [Sulfurovum sp. zt1-1]|uniref:Probable oxaloacetate decarboxylase gamma chain n=1 Tax=Sulfurovum zhangzhouensis TaxID=3019067 RepID=A0ABT7QV12_9BACT|nr:OadG family protein [Sulfurovum zhangzhouensis]MDM5270679.1 OadG family protein [Sulfurovum zhangzhouensis]
METDVNIVFEAIKFMVLGMGVVYLFLVILVQVMNLQAKVIAKYFTAEEPPAAPATPSSSVNSDESARVAAIIAAVTEFRKNK